jgi:hypothetical protein
MRTTCFLILGIALAVLPICLVSGEQIANPFGNGITLLQAKDQKMRLEGQRLLLDQRKQIVSSLIAVLDKEAPDASWGDPNTTPSLAISVLGELRAPEAVHVLLKWAVAEDVPFIDNALAAGSRPSPAFLALVKIGKPAEPALLDSMRLKPEKAIWGISIGILKEIEGVKCAAIILEEAIAEEAADSPAKEHLQAALKKLKEEK